MTYSVEDSWVLPELRVIPHSWYDPASKMKTEPGEAVSNADLQFLSAGLIVVVCCPVAGTTKIRKRPTMSHLISLSLFHFELLKDMSVRL